MLKLSMNMNLLSQQRKVKLRIEVWKIVFLNMRVNYNLLYKHPSFTRQRNYKTSYLVLILTYFFAYLSCSNAACILFSSPEDGCDVIHLTPSMNNSVCSIFADFYLN
jgi:hypothetical protein